MPRLRSRSENSRSRPRALSRCLRGLLAYHPERDQTTKNAEYRDTPSIQRYVMLSQQSISANIYERAGDRWIGTLITAADVMLAMPELGIELPLAALYDGLTFDTPA